VFVFVGSGADVPLLKSEALFAFHHHNILY